MPDDVDDLLESVRKAAEIDAEANYRVMDNHLLHSDRVIANAASLSSLNDTQLIETALEIASDPTTEREQ